jgi:hypothetical protein
MDKLHEHQAKRGVKKKKNKQTRRQWCAEHNIYPLYNEGDIAQLLQMDIKALKRGRADTLDNPEWMRSFVASVMTCNEHAYPFQWSTMKRATCAACERGYLFDAEAPGAVEFLKSVKP